MRFVYWWVFLFLKILARATKKPLIIGFSLILMSFYLLTLLMGLFNFWYRLIFFLIYVGAVLVLVFYIVCVNAKPIKYRLRVFYLFLGGFLFLIIKIIFNTINYNSSIKFFNCSFSFFSSYSLLLISFLFSLLLFLLWIIRKFTFLSVGGIRRFV